MMKIQTSAEVWAVIRARHHKELVVFGTYSAPDGSEWSQQREMYTEYGFKDADYPLMAARTIWDDVDEKYNRTNEVTEYWLFVIQNHDD